LAQASQRTYGIPSSIKLAQAILETGFGKSELSVKGKNFFGIKAHSGPGTAGTYTINTSEFYNGQWVVISAAFRAYYTMAESFDDHGKFLKVNARYKSLFETTDPKEWARRLHACGYATDPNYPAKLIAVMDKYNLYQYDLK
jgi:flagellar protein FlgJ